MAGSRYWRLYTTSNWGAASIVALGTLELRGTVGGVNLALSGNGTASALSEYAGYPASFAFDANAGTTWASANSGVPLGKWVKWDFGALNSKDIAQIVLGVATGDFGATAKFRSGSLQSSDDDVIWIPRLTITDLSQTDGSYAFTVPPIAIATSSTSLPKITSASFGGAVADGIELPPLLARADKVHDVALTIPAPTSVVRGHDSSGEQSAGALMPMLLVGIATGASSEITLPLLSPGASGTSPMVANAPLGLPSLAAQVTAAVSGMANASPILPALSGRSYAGALCSITIGGLTTRATGTTGAVGKAHVTLPMFEVTANATAQNRGSADITLPGPRVGATVRTTLSLPSLKLTAIGSAVITATYEAYAVNLKHTPRPGVEPVDETTRYTNFPFTHVIRHKGSYYGANSTGLYLLEGTTDDASPITWSVKTAMTDFKSLDKKTIATAYFGGRFGPASTVQLHAGEHAPNTYNFSTPRDQLAQNYRQVFGKGVKERYYALGASGAGVVELDNIELDVHKLTRRI